MWTSSREAGFHRSVTTPSPGRHPAETRQGRRSGAMAKVLIVEDDDVIAKGMATTWRRRVRPSVDRTGELGLTRLRYERPDVCVARPDAPRARRLERDRARAGGGHRHADHRRQRARQGARPRPRARARRRRLPRQALLDEGARRAGARRGAAGRPRAGAGPRRADRDRGAAHRPGQRAGLRQRGERRPDPDRVPPALRARARAGPRGHPRRAAAEGLGPPGDAPRPHRRRLRPQAPPEDRPARSDHTFIQTRFGVGYKLDPGQQPHRSNVAEMPPTSREPTGCSTGSSPGSTSTPACSSSPRPRTSRSSSASSSARSSSSNLDEFFMVRVAGLMGQEASGMHRALARRADAAARPWPRSASA